MKRTILAAVAVLLALAAAAARSIELQSPDGCTKITVICDEALYWSVERGGETLLAPSAIALQTDRGVWGEKPRPTGIKRMSENKSIPSPLYRQSHVADI